MAWPPARGTMRPMRIIGIDPGLARTGWGVIAALSPQRMRFVACGVVATDAGADLAVRLAALDAGLAAVLAAHTPAVAAVEETYVNRNPASALKLGQARGVCVLAPARAGVPVREFAPAVIKKALTGTGRAEKGQIALMVRRLLPGCGEPKEDAADALAVALTCAFQGMP